MNLLLALLTSAYTFFVVSFLDNSRVFIDPSYRLVTLAGIERTRRDTCAGQFTERGFVEVLQGPLDAVTYERPGDPSSPAYLWRNGKLLNAELLRLGYARPSADVDRLSQRDALRRAVFYAQIERRGLWATCRR